MKWNIPKGAQVATDVVVAKKLLRQDRFGQGLLDSSSYRDKKSPKADQDVTDQRVEGVSLPRLVPNASSSQAPLSATKQLLFKTPFREIVADEEEIQRIEAASQLFTRDNDQGGSGSTTGSGRGVKRLPSVAPTLRGYGKIDDNDDYSAGDEREHLVAELVNSIDLSPTHKETLKKLSKENSFSRSINGTLSKGILPTACCVSMLQFDPTKFDRNTVMAPRDNFKSFIYHLRRDIENFGLQNVLKGTFPSQASDTYSLADIQEAYIRYLGGLQRSKNVLLAPQEGINLTKSTREGFVESLISLISPKDLEEEGFAEIKDALTFVINLQEFQEKLYASLLEAMSLGTRGSDIDLEKIQIFKTILKEISSKVRFFKHYPQCELVADNLVKCICEEAALRVLLFRNRLVGEVLLNGANTECVEKSVNILCHTADALMSTCELEWLFRSKLDFHNPDHSYEVASAAYLLMKGVQEFWGSCSAAVFSAGMRHDSRMVFLNPEQRNSGRVFGKDIKQSEGASFDIWERNMRKANEELFYMYPQLIKFFPGGCLLFDLQSVGARFGIEYTVPEFSDFSSKESKGVGKADGLDCVSNQGELLRLPKEKGAMDPLLLVRDSISHELTVSEEERISFYQKEFAKSSTLMREALEKILLKGMVVSIADLTHCVEDPKSWLESATLRLFAEMFVEEKLAILKGSETGDLKEETREAIDAYIKFVADQAPFSRGRATILLERILFPCRAMILNLKELKERASLREGLGLEERELGAVALDYLRDLGIGSKISFDALSLQKRDPNVEGERVLKVVDEVIGRLEIFLNNLFETYCLGEPFKVNRAGATLAEAEAVRLTALVRDEGGYLPLAHELRANLAQENGFDGDISLEGWKHFTGVSGELDMFLSY
ncbi:hypothetical protein AB751O23_AA_00620 [Chlamydiales bacterium SCGC AB-751-O23]|jgi:hypothetical protein|nr:hypothetical protein AB751O23_AA_00620 [Chlamydiales bacterium SCGC AB-751-O23]